MAGNMEEPFEESLESAAEPSDNQPTLNEDVDDEFHSKPSKFRLKKPSVKIKYSDESATKVEKKPRMRTASDVISRILWDPDLPSNNFVVGYLDRFVGIVEKEFLYFNWDEDLASIDDHDVLVAIPKHRIVYFKYRDTKVWDKSQRLDLVFGSTSTFDSETLSIHDYVRQLDEQFEMNRAKGDVDDDDDDVNSADDDDSVHVQMMQPRPQVCRLERTTANYFVAIRVTNPDVLRRVTEIKRRICVKEPLMTELLMSNNLMHITLCMLRLDGPFDLENAVEAIESCRLRLADEFFLNEDRLVQVHLKGLATFRGGQVLYVKVDVTDADHRFHALRRAVLQHLRDAKVQIFDRGFVEYVPHMTLLKLTRARVGVLRNPYVDPFLYVEDADYDLGVQACDNLKLCIIGEDKRSDGFYRCDAEVDFK